MSSTSCFNCGSKEELRSNGECAACANRRVRQHQRRKRATPEGRAEYNKYMRDLRQRKKGKNT